MENKIKFACKQITEILNCYDENLLKKIIPIEILNNIKNNSSKDLDFNVDPYNFDYSQLTDEALELLFLLFYKYIANKKQKKKIEAYFKPISTESFNLDELFKKQKKEDENLKQNVQLITYSKHNLIKRLLLKITQILKDRK